MRRNSQGLLPAPARSAGDAGPGRGAGRLCAALHRWLVGYLSYDFGRRLEQLPEQARDDLGFADATLGLYAWALISDHHRRTTQLMFHPTVETTERQRLIRLFEAEASAESDAAFQLLAPSSPTRARRSTSVPCSASSTTSAPATAIR